MTLEKGMVMKMDKSTVETFRAGEIIMKEGEIYDEMYKVLSGSVAVYNRYGEPDECLIGIYSEAKCFGEWNVLSDLPNRYTVVAYDDVLVMRITGELLEGFIKNNPKNAIDIMKDMSHTVKIMQTDIALLLDDVHKMRDFNKLRMEETKQKIMQYKSYGFGAVQSDAGELL